MREESGLRTRRRREARLAPMQVLPVTQRHWSTQRSQVTSGGSTNFVLTSLADWSGFVK